MKILKWALVTLLVLASSWFLTAAFLLGPMLSYFYLPSTHAAGCSAIRTGQERADILKAIHTSVTPYSERIDPKGRLFFRSPRCACVVNVDSSGRVVSVEITKTGYHDFVTEAVEGGY